MFFLCIPHVCVQPHDSRRLLRFCRYWFRAVYRTSLRFLPSGLFSILPTRTSFRLSLFFSLLQPPFSLTLHVFPFVCYLRFFPDAGYFRVKMKPANERDIEWKKWKGTKFEEASTNDSRFPISAFRRRKYGLITSPDQRKCKLALCLRKKKAITTIWIATLSNDYKSKCR